MTRLTVALPEDLSRRAKARAALEGTTLSEVVRHHLEEFAAGLDLLEEAEDLRAVREIEERLERGEEPVYDWDVVKAELDALPPEDNRRRKPRDTRAAGPRPPASSARRRDAG